MKPLLPILLILLLSCSKQESSTTTTDTTQSVTTTTPPVERTVVQLTPDQIEKVAWAIFLKFHDVNLMEDPDLMAYVEEFSVEGDKIYYKLLVHNGDDAGWHRSDEEEEDPPYAEQAEEAVVDETEEERLAREQYEEQMAEEERANQEYQERYGSTSPPEFPTWDYRNEIDTLSYEGYYVAYLEAGTPESPTKTVRIVFTGKINHQNHVDDSGYDEQPDEVPRAPFNIYVADILVDLGAPTMVERDLLYLRAKITELAEKDIAGMSKDELGYLRNEIFARHGHTFKTPKMNDHFMPMRWYHTIDNDAAPLLNKFEKRNVEFIKKKEG